jgi:hypothetical protein
MIPFERTVDTHDTIALEWTVGLALGGGKDPPPDAPEYAPDSHFLPLTNC